jgi:hypothetical protein
MLGSIWACQRRKLSPFSFSVTTLLSTPEVEDDEDVPLGNMATA